MRKSDKIIVGGKLTNVSRLSEKVITQIVRAAMQLSHKVSCQKQEQHEPYPA